MTDPRPDVCLWLTADELKLMLTALDAYSHNTDYVRLIDRLSHQVASGDLPRPPLGRAPVAMTG